MFRRLADVETGAVPRVTLMDGRGFRVHSHSTDPEAARGYASGGYARGYKLHALATENGRFIGIRITPMNVSEKRVARELIDEHRPVGFLLADQGYESGNGRWKICKSTHRSSGFGAACFLSYSF